MHTFLASAAPTTIPFPFGGTTPGSTIPLPFGGSISSGGVGSAHTSIVSASGIGGLSLLAGLLIGAVALLVLIVPIAVFVIVVVANRADPDGTGRRPISVYYFAVSFVTLFTTVVGTFIVVSGLVRLIGAGTAPPGGPSMGDSVARSTVIGLLIAIASAALLLTHLRRGVTLASIDPAPTSPSLRVGQSYVSAVAFVAVVSLLVAAVVCLYTLFALAAPGVFGSLGGRDVAARLAIDTAYAVLVAAAILRTHRRLLPPGIRFLGGSTSPPGQTPAPPPPRFEPPDAVS